MSSKRVHGPVSRWAESRDGDALDARLGELFRNVDEPRALSNRELTDVAARMRAVGGVRKPLLLGRYAVLLAVGMLAGTGFAVVGHGVKRWVETPAQAPPVNRVVAAPPAPAARARTPREPRPAQAEVAPPVASAVPQEPVRTFEALPPPVANGALARESELLSRALVKLRREGDPAGALAVLAEYRREFPRGTLELESEVARLDAYLALGREADALQLLDTLPIDRIGRGAELRVVRAELRAREAPGRAVRDFDLALAASLSGPLEERALFGRAASRLRAGDEAGATADLRRYVSRFPRGRFAAEARAKLGERE